MAPSDNTRWYARRNGTVRGPFTDEDMARYLLLGRIRLEDELSHDRLGWRPAGDYPELLPGDLLNPSSREDYRKLAIARMRVDERLHPRRENGNETPRSSRKERRRLPDRRRFDSEAEFFGYPLRDDIPLASQLPEKRQTRLSRPFLLPTLLVTLIFVLFSVSAT